VRSGWGSASRQPRRLSGLDSKSDPGCVIGAGAVATFLTGSRASLRSAEPSGSACPRCAAGRFACGPDLVNQGGAGVPSWGRVWWQGRRPD